MSKKKYTHEGQDYDYWENLAKGYTISILTFFTICAYLMIGFVKGCWRWLRDLLSKKEVSKNTDAVVDDKPRQRT
jgi:hypothetical protein